MVTVRIRRQDPAVDAEPRWQEYQVPRDRALRALDVLEYIQEEVDPTLGYRPHLCRDSCCGACWVTVDGRARMSCITPLNQKLEVITLEPASSHALVRDLIVDFSRSTSGGKEPTGD